VTRLGSLATIGLMAVSRIAQLVAVILIIATFNFVLVRAAPGDPAQVMAGQSGASDPKLLDDQQQDEPDHSARMPQEGTYRVHHAAPVVMRGSISR
jgi:ABC-type dipeptide/oligopeptide/nickel transport system permease component